MRIARIMVGIILMMIMTTGAFASVEISEVMYDPVNTETGGEAVELYNTGNSDVDISGYKIGTETTLNDVVLPNGTVIKAKSYFLIADAGFSSLKDNPSWPEADYEEAITMSNTNAGVALIYPNGTIIDAVGWGDPLQIDAGLFEGTPANHVAQGMSLIRANHSGNNAVDFAESSPDLVNSNGGSGGMVGSNETYSGIAFTITVTNPLTTILSMAIPDDNPTENGTQILPMPKETRYFQISLNATNAAGNDSIGNLSAVFNGQTFIFNRTRGINSTTSTYTAEIPIRFYESAGDYDVEIRVMDGNETSSINKTVEVQELNAYEIDAKSLRCTITAGRVCEILGDLDMGSADKPTIRNIGNIPLNFEVSGKNMVSGNKTVDVSRISYQFGNLGQKNLSLSPILNAVELEQGNNSVIKMNFEVGMPADTKAGNYSTQIMINSIAS